MAAARFLKLWQDSRQHLKSVSFITALLLLSACQIPTRYIAPSQPTGSTLSPVSATAQATHYAIRSELSDVRLLVFRAGPLATLGHNHVIQAKNIMGEIYLDTNFHRSQFSLIIPVIDLKVDAAQARSEEGEEFAKKPDAAAIAGTTKNMLGDKVLHATLYPHIAIRSVGMSGPAWAPEVTVRIKLRSVERDFTFPVSIDYRNDAMTVTSAFEIKQTDFGITPLSMLGGAVQVADTLKVRISLVAQK